MGTKIKLISADEIKDTFLNRVPQKVDALAECYESDILEYATLEANRWVTSSHELTVSGSWDTYVINADILLGISKLAVYSTYTSQYAVAFYSSKTISADTFISGLNFYDTSAKNTFEDISIPEGAVIAVILNRKASGTDIEMIGGIKVNHIDVKADVENVKADVENVKADVENVKADVEDIKECYESDILEYATSLGSYYVSNDKKLKGSGLWTSYYINTSQLSSITKASLWTNNASFYGITFYSSEIPTDDAFISGLTFVSSGKVTFENIEIPEGAVTVLFANRTSSGEDIEVVVIGKVNHIEEKERLDRVESDVTQIKESLEREKQIITVDLMEDNEFKNGVYGYYIANGNILTGSLNWGSWLITDIALYSEHVFNCWTSGFPSIAFYSSTVPTDDTFISSITHTVAGVFAELKISKSDIPEGTKSILFCSRTASGEGTTLHATITTVERLDVIENSFNKLNQESKGRGNIKAIFSTIPNSNDFAVIKDEIWFAQNIYKDGVASEETNIHRYKIVEDSLIRIGDIHSDFGHWNVVDYNEDNDCLVFGNAANLTTTDGNFFSVVKNPLALGSEATLATCGIKYPVDIGYKVQAVWGDSNWGKNNIVYLMSNNAKTITKVMLLRDENGEFKVNSETGYGEYIVLETKELDIDIGVGGADFWGDTLYIGIGVRYRLAMMSMTDYSVKEIEKHYYYDDGTEYSGSTQGVHVDSKYIWVFSNVGGKTENHLVQYYR